VLRASVPARLVLIADTEVAETCREEGERVWGLLIAVEAILRRGRMLLVISPREGSMGCGMTER
jgi:hypothetical protein